MLLKVKEMTVCYDKAIAIDHISLELYEGSVVCIIGANGAGKTTILRALSNLTPLTSGEIWFLDRRIDQMSVVDIVKLGLIHLPEGRRLFPYLSVFNNLRLGASLQRDKASIKRSMDTVFELFPILKARRNQQAGTLSGGEQQMLCIGRGLMAQPKLLLMDEPSVGLAPILVDKLVPTIKNINQSGVSVLLVEQNVPLAFKVASKGYALDTGKIVLEGDISQFETSDIVKRAYLGG